MVSGYKVYSNRPTIHQFYFIFSAIYCDVILVKHRKRPQNREIPLPERCNNKLMLYDLEVRRLLSYSTVIINLVIYTQVLLCKNNYHHLSVF